MICCKLVMSRLDLLGKNTSVSGYHLPVSIQHRLNNESRKPFDYPDIAVKKVSNRGYVRRGGGLLLLLLLLLLFAGGVASEKSPPPKGFILIAIFL